MVYKMTAQTVLYESHTGKVPWKLPAEFIAQLNESFKGIKDTQVNLDKGLKNHQQITTKEIRELLGGKLTCNNNSLASQMQKKHPELRVLSVGDNLLFRPTAGLEIVGASKPAKTGE